MKTVSKKRSSIPVRAQIMRLVPYAIGVILLMVVPPFLTTYYRSLLTESLIFAIFAMSLNIVLGYTGLLDFGHAAYFGTAGYVVGALVLHYNSNNFWISAPLAILIAGLLAAVFGLIALRLSGLYFLLITFALGELVSSFTFNWSWLKTPGSEVITGIFKPSLGIPGFSWSHVYFYYFVFLLFVICFFLIYRLINSPFGRALEGIREGESRMRSLGYNTWFYKYVVFIIGGLFAALAGILFAYYNGMVVPTYLGVDTSAMVLLMVIIGGAGTLLGPVIGAAVMIFLQLIASVYTPERWPLILGASFVAAMLWLRGGIAVHLLKLWKKVAYGNVKDGSIKS